MHTINRFYLKQNNNNPEVWNVVDRSVVKNNGYVGIFYGPNAELFARDLLGCIELMTEEQLNGQAN